MPTIPPSLINGLKKATRPFFAELKKILTLRTRQHKELAFREYNAQTGKGRADFDRLPAEDQGNWLRVFGKEGEEFSVRGATKILNTATGEILTNPGASETVRREAMQIRSVMLSEINNLPRKLVKAGKFSLLKEASQELRDLAKSGAGPIQHLRDNLNKVVPKAQIEKLEELVRLNTRKVELEKAFTKGEIDGEARLMFAREIDAERIVLRKELGIIPDDIGDDAFIKKLSDFLDKDVPPGAEKMETGFELEKLTKAVRELLTPTTKPTPTKRELTKQKAEDAEISLRVGLSKKSFTKKERNKKGTADIIDLFPEGGS